jgi:fibrinogen beta/gamma subunit family protein
VRCVALLIVVTSACSFKPRLGANGDDAGTGSSADASQADASSDAAPDAFVAPLISCAAILADNASAPSGVYTIDPDGSGGAAAFPVLCDMTTRGGGWTLVGKELPFANGSAAGPLRFLGVDSMNPAELAAGTQSGVIGVRFAGAYQTVSITWGTNSFIQFAKPTAFDMFSSTVSTSVNVASFATSDGLLNGWVMSDGGAKLCVAASSPNTRPGDTSWAIKPRNDNHAQCGCNDMSWAGRGAYYGGTPAGQQTVCDGWGGGWAGPKDNAIQKGGLAPAVATSLWIR